MRNEACCGVRDYEASMDRLKSALTELGNAASEAGWLSACLSDIEFECMKNCVNCGHFDVCVVVHDRKRRQAGDYSPFSKWKLCD